MGNVFGTLIYLGRV